ncbi:uncharacterized protein G2W53_034003 [Senna tora]|uniref:Uncharacterized protein n=1 Tax=Senna tora TaxID=362788 RepID=A0A834T184_9FABA|nr:uncharacterized protein G2W53_034003 [Senna tora]
MAGAAISTARGNNADFRPPVNRYTIRQPQQHVSMSTGLPQTNPYRQLSPQANQAMTFTLKGETYRMVALSLAALRSKPATLATRLHLPPNQFDIKLALLGNYNPEPHPCAYPLLEFSHKKSSSQSRNSPIAN